MMDNNISQEWLADAQAIVAEVGQTVVINGVSFLALMGEPTVTQTLEVGGLMERVSVNISVPATASAIAAKTHMQHGKTVIHDGRSLRVVAFTHTPGTAWLQMQVQDADQR